MLHLAQLLLWLLAFWWAVLRWRAQGLRRHDPAFLLALVAGAASAFLLSALIAGDAGGATLLGLPLGPLVAVAVAVGSDRFAALERFLSALPRPVAIARLGCVVAGCCGARTDLHGLPMLSPPALECAAFWSLSHLPGSRHGAAFLLATGALRHWTLPWRDETEALAVSLIASLWTFGGLALATFDSPQPVPRKTNG